MATVVFVTPEDVDVLRKYLGASDSGSVVLVYPGEAQDALSSLGVGDDEEVDYDHGGESDLMVDVVSNKSHYFISQVRIEQGLEPEDDDDC